MGCSLLSDISPYATPDVPANSAPNTPANTTTNTGLFASEDAGGTNRRLPLLAINPLPHPLRRHAKAVPWVKSDYQQHVIFYENSFQSLIKLL